MEKYDIENLKKRAEQGDTYAMLYLGNIYRFGKDDIEPDAEKAFALYENAAKGGNTAGYLFMGVLYEYGEGVLQDDLKAAACYQYCSEQ